MASSAKREASRIVVYAIDDWLVRYMENAKAGVLDPAVSVEARAELEAIKEAHLRVAQADEPTRPPGWNGGNPPVGVCSCDACVARKVAMAKAQGRLKP